MRRKKERMKIILKSGLKGAKFPIPWDYTLDDINDESEDEDYDGSDSIEKKVNVRLATFFILEAPGILLERAREIEGKKEDKLPSACTVRKQLPLEVECAKCTINKTMKVGK